MNKNYYIFMLLTFLTFKSIYAFVPNHQGLLSQNKEFEFVQFVVNNIKEDLSRLHVALLEKKMPVQDLLDRQSYVINKMRRLEMSLTDTIYYSDNIQYMISSYKELYYLANEIKVLSEHISTIEKRRLEQATSKETALALTTILVVTSVLTLAILPLCYYAASLEEIQQPRTI